MSIGTKRSDQAVANTQAPVLSVAGLTTSFMLERRWIPVVRNVSFDIAARETVAIVGESGSGKSVTALSIMRLIPQEIGRVEGRVMLAGRDLLALPEASMTSIRGNDVAMIFQEPMTSLNPVLTIGFQIAEALIQHRGLSRAAAEAETIRLLDRVRIPAATSRFHEHPHRFSGGMRQRVMIAMALACRPKLLIADEPTTALDVTIQGQILDLIADLVEERGMSMILISHDLGVIAENVQRMMVMYGGTVVESGPTDEVFRRMGHPYTQGLFRARPKLGARKGTRLKTISGTVPELADLPSGCTFSDRCPLVIDRCRAALPPMVDVGPGHLVRCIRTDVSMAERVGALTA